MLSMKLILAFSVLTGIFVDECSLGDLDIADYADKVTVTNASADSDAFVGVTFNHGRVSVWIPAGKSRTAIAIAATKYTVKVVGRADGDLDFYKDGLLGLRSRLEGLTRSSTASADEIATAAMELMLVQSALEQMQGSNSVQSCSGTLTSGVTSQVTVRWNPATDVPGFWVLNCG